MQKNPLFTGLVYINSEFYGSLDCAQRTKLHELSFKIDVRLMKKVRFFNASCSTQIILLFGAAMESKFVARCWKYKTAK